MTQAYYENLMLSGKYSKSSRKEGLREWFSAGPYFHHRLSDGSENENNHVSVYSQFSALAARRPILLLFDHHLKTLSLSMSNGVVTDIQISD
jgi:hypothetical protein